MIEDFIDLGEGYEEDSFVDNSEAVGLASLICFCVCYIALGSHHQTSMTIYAFI